MRRRLFGILPDGRRVHAYTLEGSGGLTAEVLDYGGIIHKLLVPDREGRVRNVVLAYDELADYLENPAYVGALVGRAGGRIGPSGLTIDGKNHELDRNHGQLTLHGGHSGFHQQAMDVVSSGPSHLEMRFLSPAGQSGFPGRLDVGVTFRVVDQQLEITMAIETTAATYVNPTHHTYFNLSGDPTDSVAASELTIDADAVAVLDEWMLPVGWQATEALGIGRVPVDLGTVLASDLPALMATHGIDHPFRLRGSTEAPAAALYHPESGRRLEVYCDTPCLVVYTGNFLSEAEVPSGRRFADHTGICFEAQELPDAVNNGLSPFTFLRPGEVQRRTIIYRFK